MKYIINTSECYADEFYYPICSVIFEKDRQQFIDLYPDWKYPGFRDFNFGSNEALSFSSKQLLDMITKATPLDDDLFMLVEPFLPQASLDITGYIYDTLTEYGYEFEF